jgi:hypothetical protein
MPIELSIASLVKDAEAAVEYAQAVRATHARKSERASAQRKTDIKLAQERLTEAMKPVRRRIARLPYMASSPAEKELRAASFALQRERRKLWKMAKPKSRRN